MVCANCGQDKEQHRVLMGIHFCKIENAGKRKKEILKAITNEDYLLKNFSYKEAE